MDNPENYPHSETLGSIPITDANFSPSSALATKAAIEAIIFASPTPISIMEIQSTIGPEAILLQQISTVVAQLMDEYRTPKYGFELVHLKEQGYQFRTKEDHAPLVEKMFLQRPRPLSRAAQETLAIIAYRQPVTRADIEFIRGVDVGSILKGLLDKGLIAATGRREIVGRPMTFGTTDEFLRVYKLSTLSDLPPLESFQPAVDLVKSALSRLDQQESSQGQNEPKEEIVV